MVKRLYVGNLPFSCDRGGGAERFLPARGNPFRAATRVRRPPRGSDRQTPRENQRDSITIKVTARHGEHLDTILQRFPRICSNDGIFRGVKRRRFYEKPSAARRRKARGRRSRIGAFL